jgi:hypothetical protein
VLAVDMTAKQECGFAQTELDKNVRLLRITDLDAGKVGMVFL